jgi:hypothetical protein
MCTLNLEEKVPNNILIDYYYYYIFDPTGVNYSTTTSSVFDSTVINVEFVKLILIKIDLNVKGLMFRYIHVKISWTEFEHKNHV